MKRVIICNVLDLAEQLNNIKENYTVLQLLKLDEYSGSERVLCLIELIK